MALRLGKVECVPNILGRRRTPAACALAVASMVALAACSSASSSAAQSASPSARPSATAVPRLTNAQANDAVKVVTNMCTTKAPWTTQIVAAGPQQSAGAQIDEATGYALGCRFIFFSDSDTIGYTVTYLSQRVGVSTAPGQPVMEMAPAVAILLHTAASASISVSDQWLAPGVALRYEGEQYGRAVFEAVLLDTAQNLGYQVRQFTVPGYQGTILAVVFQAAATTQPTAGTQDTWRAVASATALGPFLMELFSCPKS